MSDSLSPVAIAFAGTTRLAEGPLATVAGAVATWLAQEPTACVLVFDAVDSRPIDLDLRGTPEDVRTRYTVASAPIDPADEAVATDRPAPRGPGRPKLGVVPREVTLLPRHWEWLAAQPGGASVALRKLVEEARRKGEGKQRIRKAQESAYRFLTTMAGNEPGYEEGLRALFAADAERFRMYASAWPPDIKAHALKLAAPVFEPAIA